MTTGFHFMQALIQDGNPNCYPVIESPVTPGMPNRHSHSFHYVMAGLSELRRNPVDSFWS